MTLPATESAIASAVAELSKVIGRGEVPHVLLAQWRKLNGFQGDNVEFYSTTEIADRNEVFEVATYCPCHVAFANDGGSKVALLEAKENAQEVLISSMGMMTPSRMKRTSQDLDEWIQKGCAFEEEIEPEFSAFESVRLQLDKVPDDGIKGLMLINKALNLGLSITALKQMEEHLPVVLDKMSYISALRIVKKLKAASFLSIWLDSQPKIQLPLESHFD